MYPVKKKPLGSELRAGEKRPERERELNGKDTEKKRRRDKRQFKSS